MEQINKRLKEIEKEQENKLLNTLEKLFPEMIEKKQCIYIEPIVKHFPKIINKLQERWEVEFKYDESGTEIHFLCPRYKI